MITLNKAMVIIREALADECREGVMHVETSFIADEPVILIAISTAEIGPQASELLKSLGMEGFKVNENHVPDARLSTQRLTDADLTSSIDRLVTRGTP